MMEKVIFCEDCDGKQDCDTCDGWSVTIVKRFGHETVLTLNEYLYLTEILKEDFEDWTRIMGKMKA